MIFAFAWQIVRCHGERPFSQADVVTAKGNLQLRMQRTSADYVAESLLSASICVATLCSDGRFFHTFLPQPFEGHDTGNKL